MTHQSALAALAALLALSAQTTAASEEIALADCYENVIIACGQTAHPQSCALQAFERCDVAHTASAGNAHLAAARSAPSRTPELASAT